ncbi:hypothetical protein K438DRAFT_1749782 [Mycena galopus ATCC 62051]|nr:hypothetical protein K438DRAFT_1749782 [Mycena galopus ATCC 62051]
MQNEIGCGGGGGAGKGSRQGGQAVAVAAGGKRRGSRHVGSGWGVGQGTGRGAGRRVVGYRIYVRPAKIRISQTWGEHSGPENVLLSIDRNETAGGNRPKKAGRASTATRQRDGGKEGAGMRRVKNTPNGCHRDIDGTSDNAGKQCYAVLGGARRVLCGTMEVLWQYAIDGSHLLVVALKIASALSSGRIIEFPLSAIN